MFAKLFRSFRKHSNSAPRVLFIDDVTAGDVEILPATEADWCREQITAIATARPTATGSGFAEATVRYPREAARTIADLEIPTVAARRALAGNLMPFEAVVTGDPNAPTPTRGRGYGPSPLSAAVIYETDGSDTVSAMEVTLRGNPAETIAVLSAIAAIPSRERLIATDWAGLAVVELADAAAIQRFAHRSG